MGMIFMNTEKNKTSKPQKVILNVSQKLDFTSSNYFNALQKLPIYYTWKNIKQK